MSSLRVKVLSRFLRTGFRLRFESNMNTPRIPIAGIGLFGTLLSAQWLNYAESGTPRTPDGKANLSAPTPRACHVRPDLSGVWQIEPAAPGEIEQMLHTEISSSVVP